MPGANVTFLTVYVETDPASAGTNTASYYIDDFTLTTAPPAMPVLASPVHGTVTNDTTPTITGTADAGNTVTVTEGGTTICTATVGDTGNWSCVPAVGLSQGGHSLAPTARDADGVATAGYPATVVVDTTAPPAPVITSPANAAVLPASPSAVSGTGEAFNTVTVTEGAATICTATVQGNGAWACRPSPAFAAGSHTLTARSVDLAGNGTTGAAITFTVDVTAPAVPAITSPANNALTNDATPTVTGTGEVGTTITVLRNGTAACTATVAAGGTWTCTPTVPIPDGIHRLTPRATDAAGNTSTGSAILLTVDATPPVVPDITSPTAGAVVTDVTPTFTGTGETGTTITILDSGTPICTVPILVCGHWTCTPTNPLALGSHTFTPRAQDTAGNTSTGIPVTVTLVAAVVTAQAVDSPPRCLVPH
jgi:hypothetical protein